MTSVVSSPPGFSAEKRRVALHSMLAAAAMAEILRDTPKTTSRWSARRWRA
jgi:hypothetical protein